jgi:AcrR family transcriptional regulator
MARGRPRLFDSSALLTAAREVFLRRGLHATTEEVAARAGVSEGLLYHRFGNKERLFREAMELPAGSRPECLEALGAESGVDVREVLQRTALGLIEWGMMEMPLLMMSWSNRDNPSIQSRLEAANDPPLHEHRAVRDYLSRMRTRGALVPDTDADAMALAFLGGVRGFVFLRVVYGARRARQAQTPQAFAGALARLMVPERPVEKPTGRPRRQVARTAPKREEVRAKIAPARKRG